ncbi:Sec-independent protein translocase TatB [Alcanivorax xiamenensis]|uniref:Sec-independent protein translocase protein TatB n=1 Tax=Alcanivorax xiamenensis TaxID=1177156 RepID=A0ABQ6Y6R9_9GAMM|nr:Sec-independent protein translocase protein TatB [Alcanivorax xiamenensis]KAF0804727.1 Sec-independent protein translocase TatB [Alcanivorax xiamenensis]
MFDVGFSELLLIFVIALVVLGPERLPKAARTLGYWIGRARSTFNNLRNELEREALNMDMRERMEKQMREMGLDEDSIRKAKDSLLSPDEVAQARQKPDPIKAESRLNTLEPSEPASSTPEEKKSDE